MKILYHHRTRATDAQKVHILEMINAFRAQGHNVQMAALVDAERPRSPESETSVPCWKRILQHLPFGYELAQLGYNVAGVPVVLSKLLRCRPDFVYERHALFNFSGVLAARLARVPIVVEVNSPFAIEQRRDNEIGAERLAGWMEKRVLNGATKIVVVTRLLGRILTEAGVDASKIVVMPNGVNLARFSGIAPSPKLRRSLNLMDRTVVAFSGWFRPWHGLELLIDAFRESGLPAQGAVLLLIGDGPAAALLRKQVEAQRLSDSVVFTGPVSHGEIPRYLALADIAVQPAANEYCCPMKILEYMAAAKPVIAPRQENIEELLEDGRNALLFPPGDQACLGLALTRLAKDAGERQRLGQCALQTIHERGLLWERNAGAVVDMVAGAAR